MELFSFPAMYDTAFQFRNAQGTVDFVEDCVRMYTDIPVRSVVDLACGTGHYTLEFARRGYATYGVDIDDRMCRYMQRKSDVESLAVELICADMADFSLPRQCDLAVNFFDSLTYVIDAQRIVAHLRAVANALVSGALYVLEIGVIDDFENHNVEEIWTEHRRDFSVTSTYFRDGIIDPEQRTFIEQCSFRTVCREHSTFLVLKQRKLALYFEEFLELVEQANCFLSLVYFDDFVSDAFLPKDGLPWRVIALLRKK